MGVGMDVAKQVGGAIAPMVTDGINKATGNTSQADWQKVAKTLRTMYISSEEFRNKIKQLMSQAGSQEQADAAAGGVDVMGRVGQVYNGLGGAQGIQKIAGSLKGGGDA